MSCCSKRGVRIDNTMETSSKKENAYLDLLSSKFQIALKRFSNSVFLLGVHSDSDEPPNVEPSFYEVKILGEGISDTEVPLVRDFLGRLS
jgi:hypothetical protein